MENSRGPKNPRSEHGEGKDGVAPATKVVTRRGGFGPVARFIAEYGGVRKALNKSVPGRPRANARLQDEGRVASAQTYLQWHNFDGKYPQSCVTYCRFERNSKLRALFNYLQEREWVLQADLVRKEEKTETIAELRAVEAVLIWLVTNLSEHED